METKKFQKFVYTLCKEYFGYPVLSIYQPLDDPMSVNVETGSIASSVILSFLAKLCLKYGVHWYVAPSDDYCGCVVKCYVG